MAHPRPSARRAAQEDPIGFVDLPKPMVIDEIQRVPELLLTIKEQVDNDLINRDVRQLSEIERTSEMRTLIRLLAARLGQLVVASALGSDIRLPHRTVGRYLGGLILIALQTEIKVDRNTARQWKFRLHKKAMRGSTLGQFLRKLLALYANTLQK